jgi:hypothetical protein
MSQSVLEPIEKQLQIDDMHQGLAESELNSSCICLDYPPMKMDTPPESLLFSPLAVQPASMSLPSPSSSPDSVFALPDPCESAGSPMELIPTYSESILMAPPQYCMTYNQPSDLDGPLLSPPLPLPPPPAHELNWAWPTSTTPDMELPGQLFSSSSFSLYDYKVPSQCSSNHNAYTSESNSSMVPEGYEYYNWDPCFYTT